MPSETVREGVQITTRHSSILAVLSAAHTEPLERVRLVLQSVTASDLAGASDGQLSALADVMMQCQLYADAEMACHQLCERRPHDPMYRYALTEARFFRGIVPRVEVLEQVRHLWRESSLTLPARWQRLRLTLRVGRRAQDETLVGVALKELRLLADEPVKDDIVTLMAETILMAAGAAIDWDDIPLARYWFRRFVGHGYRSSQWWEEAFATSLVLRLEEPFLAVFPPGVTDRYPLGQLWQAVQTGEVEAAAQALTTRIDRLPPTVWARLAADLASRYPPGSGESELLVEQALRFAPRDLGAVFISGMRLELTDLKAARDLYAQAARDWSEDSELLRRLYQVNRPDYDPTTIYSQPDPQDRGVRILPLGGADSIGASSLVIQTPETTLLIDCGLRPRNTGTPEPPAWERATELGVDLKDVEAVVVTHAHFDHTGALPRWLRDYPGAPIYATEPTRDLMTLLLQDTVRQASGDPDRPAQLWEKGDLDRLAAAIKTRPVGIPFSPVPDAQVRVTLYPAGHILGAVMVYIDTPTVRILVTGDFSLQDQETITGARVPDGLKVDILVAESTYGYQVPVVKSDRAVQSRIFLSQIERIVQQGGSVLIPAFAVGRSQEILSLLKRSLLSGGLSGVDVWMDGMVRQATSIYERHAGLLHPRLQALAAQRSLFTGDGIVSPSGRVPPEQIVARPSIVVASSGMLAEGSASSRYATALLPDARSAIFFTGYLDEESPGFRLLHRGDRKVLSLGDREIPALCQVEPFHLSAHASREEILALVLKVRPRVVYLVHGSPREHPDWPSVRTLLDALISEGVASAHLQNGELVIPCF